MKTKKEGGKETAPGAEGRDIGNGRTEIYWNIQGSGMDGAEASVSRCTRPSLPIAPNWEPTGRSCWPSSGPLPPSFPCFTGPPGARRCPTRSPHAQPDCSVTACRCCLNTLPNRSVAHLPPLPPPPGLKDILRMVSNQWDQLQQQIRRQHSWMLRALRCIQSRLLYTHLQSHEPLMTAGDPAANQTPPHPHDNLMVGML